jgi:prepilin-type N-terminal cleavage/methylation domain-containing protein
VSDHRGCVDEHGFTLVEMLAAIVIMGLVLAPLCTAFMQAMTLIPANGARTQAATDADRLQTTLGNDITQAQLINIYKAPAATGVVTPAGDNKAALQHVPWANSWAYLDVVAPYATVPCVIAASTVVADFISTTTWDGTEDYKLNPTTSVGGHKWHGYVTRVHFIPVNASWAKVEIHRWDSLTDFANSANNVTLADEGGSYLSGYCKAGETDVANAQVSKPTGTAKNETVRAAFRLHANADPTSVRASYTVEATVRTQG